MANTHSQFLKFEKAISVPKAEVEKMRSSRKALEKRIVDFFKAKSNSIVPKFYIQGSYKMRTMVIGKDGLYDVDLGIYFLTKPDVEPKTLQKWVLDAVNGHTSGGAVHKEKCIRVIYKSDFDIDLPVYYKTAQDAHPYLATKTGWVKSDPKELCDWFDGLDNHNGQLLRLVKYFKTWANNRSKKMPSGIAFTKWVAAHFKPNDRDDIAFYETAKAIKNYFLWDSSCKNPATPGDDFIAKLDTNQFDNFKDSLKSLIESAKSALEQENPLKACHIWKQQLGERFPVE